MVKKFLKRDTARFSKFGKRRKKLLSWRKPKGRDNKMREKRKGYPAVVKIGYKLNKEENRKMINNLKDIQTANKNQVLILGNLGKKKRIEIIQFAKEKNMKIKNVNINTFLKKLNKEKNKK